MANNIPLYTASREYARVHDEIPLWRESINENIRCKQAIEDAIRQSFDGMHLKPDVLNTLQQLKYDGRLSNKEWSEKLRYLRQFWNHRIQKSRSRRAEARLQDKHFAAQISELEKQRRSENIDAWTTTAIANSVSASVLDGSPNTESRRRAEAQHCLCEDAFVTSTAYVLLRRDKRYVYLL